LLEYLEDCLLSEMARREDYIRHHQLHYASILPPNTNRYNYNDPHFARRLSEQERTRAVR